MQVKILEKISSKIYMLKVFISSYSLKLLISSVAVFLRCKPPTPGYLCQIPQAFITRWRATLSVIYPPW